MKRVYILGGGGHAKVVADIIENMIMDGISLKVAGFFDDNQEVDRLLGYNRLGSIHDAAGYANSADAVFIFGLGDNMLREKIDGELKLPWLTAVHPAAYVSKYASISEGTVVMAGAVINSGAVVGRHVIVNTCAVIEHDCKISDFVHIAPNATLCGNVSVGKGSHIGAGAVVIQNKKIGSYCVVGAGGVVTDNVADNKIVKGVPAK